MSQPHRLLPYYVIKNEINDFYPKIGNRLTFPSHRSSIDSAWLVWHEAEVTSGPFLAEASQQPSIFCLYVSASIAGVLGAMRAKMLISTLESSVDYLSRHLRERIAHAKRTGIRCVGRNPHSKPMQIEEFHWELWWVYNGDRGMVMGDEDHVI